MGLLCSQSETQLVRLAFASWLLPDCRLPPLPQPFLPLSDSNALCDSDESGAEEDEDDDDAFLSDTQMTEHSDPNSYRYSSAAILFF